MKNNSVKLESLSLINCFSMDLTNRFNTDLKATREELHNIRNETINELYRITGNKQLLNFKSEGK